MQVGNDLHKDTAMAPKTDFPTADFTAANAAFYRAFAQADFGAMSRLWAEGLAVSCCHPGAAPILGRGDILDSWRQIFLHGQPSEIAFLPQQMTVIGGIGIACGLERFGNGQIACTNLFAEENGAWRMIHHQGGPILGSAQRPPQRRPDPSQATRH